MTALEDAIFAIREATNDIENLAASAELADAGVMWVEPINRGNSHLTNPRPALVLGCREHGPLIHYPWGKGGRVPATELLTDIRKHLQAHR